MIFCRIVSSGLSGDVLPLQADTIKHIEKDGSLGGYCTWVHTSAGVGENGAHMSHYNHTLVRYRDH